MISLPWLTEDPAAFPPADSALSDPNGLLAAGGDLQPERRIYAYQKGIFPWFEEDQPILWWSPDPRMVLFPDRIHISRSLKKAMKKSDFSITTDKCFDKVIEACSQQRAYSTGTWLTADMKQAYNRLFEMGAAHSVEVWNENTLVGGLYGVAMGNVFFGESMFSFRDNASKMALVALCRQLSRLGYRLIDCQVSNPFLVSMGAEEISRDEFMIFLPENTDYGRNSAHWPLE